MRKSLNDKIREERIFTIIGTILSCLGVVFIILLLFAYVITKVDVSEESYSVMTGISLAGGCFSAAYFCGKRKRRNGLKTGVICGVGVFTLLIILGIIFTEGFSGEKFISKFIIIFLCSAIGGVIGVNSRKKI